MADMTTKAVMNEIEWEKGYAGILVSISMGLLIINNLYRIFFNKIKDEELVSISESEELSLLICINYNFKNNSDLKLHVLSLRICSFY